MSIFQELVGLLKAAITFLHDIIGVESYGWAIIAFTVLVKLVLLPLTLKQLKSMRVMQTMQPKIKELQNRYKSNPQKAQQEIMKLYQAKGASPLGGCLPLLVQLPILYALFMALREFFLQGDLTPAAMRFLWIPNLGLSDPNYILPVLAAVTTFLQQWVTMKISGNTGDQTQKTMLYIMPLFMGYISYGFPAALALYWVVYSIVSTGEQFLLRREVVKEGEIEAK